MYSVHSFWTTDSQRGSSCSGRSELNDQPLAGAVAVHDDHLGCPGRERPSNRRVDLLGVEAPRLLEERLAAVSLLRLDDAGHSFDVADDVDTHASSFSRRFCAAAKFAVDPPSLGAAMAVTTAVSLNGDELTFQDVWAVAVHRVPATLSDSGREKKTNAARALVDRVAQTEHTYGINTGFGRFVEKAIPPELTEELQLRLLRSHACGVGEPYPDEVIRAAMLLRAHTLAKGYSGARVETVELLLECLNRGVLPVVPSRGSVGASGDLAPRADLAPSARG